ncbi:MAG: carbohydrate kinase family protein [Thermoplasmata archaeon]
MDAIGFGALNWDKLLKVPRIASGDEEIIVQEETSAPGGSAANTIYALAKLGFKTGFVGAIGDDAAGREILIAFDKIGVDTSRIVMRKDQPTGAAFSFIDPSGERALYINPGANDKLSEVDLDIEFMGSSQVLHMTSFCGEDQFQLQKALLDRLPESRLVSLAPGAIYAEREDLEPFLQRANIMILNRREAEKISGAGYKEGSRKLIDKGCNLVAVTLGSEGCFVASEEGDWRIPGFQTRALDTTGAGDAFAAGFLAGVLEDQSPEMCGRFGNAVAALCVSKMGTRAGLPSGAELGQFLGSR